MRQTRRRREEQRARLRLARQRPRPDQVGARARPDVEEEPGRWWRRIPWVAIGAVITVVAGIGSLVFTGIATYYGARVSADQLEQSREDTDQKIRGQAVRAAYWVDKARDGKQRLHVMNRSPDPVSKVFVSFVLRPAEWKPGDPGKARFSLRWPSMSPCSALVIDQTAMRYHKLGAAHMPSPMVDTDKEWWKKFPDNVSRTIEVEALLFTDREGVNWRRAKGKLEHARRGDRGKVTMVREGMRGGGIQGEPPVQPVKSCGGDAAP